jgi:uncharacterized membrane protein SpoIIM required for sporulation
MDLDVPGASRRDDPWLVGGSLPPAGIAPWTFDPRIQAALLAPPRPDRVTDALRSYVRGPYRRGALALLGCIALGLVIGYIGTGHDVIFEGSVSPPPGGPFVSFTVAGVWLHNLLVVGLPILLFPLLFWAPAATAGLTGYVLGRLMAVWFALHLPASLLVAALLPHGIVEVPATILGGVTAWRMGVAFWSQKRFGDTPAVRATTAVRAAAPVVAIVVVALGVAAFIEVKVTPLVVWGLAGL